MTLWTMRMAVAGLAVTVLLGLCWPKRWRAAWPCR
jgi:hypothetical protein